jgi:hypothetical protein
MSMVWLPVYREHSKTNLELLGRVRVPDKVARKGAMVALPPPGKSLDELLAAPREIGPTDELATMPPLRQVGVVGFIEYGQPVHMPALVYGADEEVPPMRDFVPAPKEEANR